MDLASPPSPNPADFGLSAGLSSPPSPPASPAWQWPGDATTNDWPAATTAACREARSARDRIGKDVGLLGKDLGSPGKGLGSPGRESGFARLSELGPLMLAIAATATVALYLLSEADWWEDWRNVLAPSIGLLLGVAIGGAFGRRRRGRSTPRTANPQLANELMTGWLALDARIQDWCPPQTADANSRDQEPEAPLGREWLSGTGFIDQWIRLHAAEEALFCVAPKDYVIGQGLIDEMRLKDSGIANEDDLLFKLRMAIAVLKGSQYLTPGPALPPGTSEIKGSDQQARVMLCEIRHTINEFRDTSRKGIVRARNSLSWTGLLTGFTAYLLLVVAMLVNVPDDFVVAAVVYFLVGAVVGLFNQLRLSTANEGGATEEDYGLAQTQLIYSPVLSGLGAVFGVVLTALLYASLSGSVIVYQAPPEPTATPTPMPTTNATVGGTTDAATPMTTVTVTSTMEPTGTATVSPTVTPSPTPPLVPLGVASPDQLPRLVDIFDLERNRFGLVLAAVFGLVPGLLVNQLQGVANRYKSGLSNTSAQ